MHQRTAKNLASCEFIVILDDDTVLEKNYIESIYQVFKEGKSDEIGVVGGIIVNRRKPSFMNALYKRML